MKKCMLLMITSIVLAMLPQKVLAQGNINEGFEAPNCNNLAYPFGTGCFSDWRSTSGSADISSNAGFPADEGSRYVHLYSRWLYNCFDNVLRQRAEGIHLNYYFQANQTYTISYAIQWHRLSSGFCNDLKTQWILTNNRANQNGGTVYCINDGGTLPAISSSDQIIKTHTPANTSNAWTTVTVTFTPSSNFNQLWLRNETLPKSNCTENADYRNAIFLDDFKLTDCSIYNFSSNFFLVPQSDFDGSVSVSCSSMSNPIPVGHWWDVYYAPNGSTSGSSQVPGNPTRWSSSAFFDQNMVINQWYYVKHGIWNDCTPWKETRRRFRVVHQFIDGEAPRFELQEEAVPFEADENYIATMAAAARNGALEEMATSTWTDDLVKNNKELQVEHFPNPFATESWINFELPEAASVSLSVSNLQGQPMAVVLQEAHLEAGVQRIRLDASDWPNGIYYYTLRVGAEVKTQMISVMK